MKIYDIKGSHAATFHKNMNAEFAIDLKSAAYFGNKFAVLPPVLRPVKDACFCASNDRENMNNNFTITLKYNSL